jgi:hypothetical protein
MKDNRDTIFQVVTALMLVAGIYLGKQYLLALSCVPIGIALWFWYKDAVTIPIIELRDITKELQKDLNTRKEIEEIKMQLHIIKNSKKGGMNPFLFLALMGILIALLLYLKEVGVI